MIVFKFGGASVKDATAVKNVAEIVDAFSGKEIVMVVSAMGKVTNALEDVLTAYYNDLPDKEETLTSITLFHTHLADELLGKKHPVTEVIRNKFMTIPGLISKYRSEHFDMVYDQVVSLGEWASTKIVAAYFHESGRTGIWMDAKENILTDDTYREGRIQWKKTQAAIRKNITTTLSEHKTVITQGFTGSSPDGNTTTLGREGSDYTAAIFSYCLDAEYMAVWKDVPGILNADPRKFTNYIKIDEMSYREAIEMTYYGAKVIHPKTIKPLQNKNIPLHVKSFIDPTGSGTIISAEQHQEYPPVVVLEEDQVLLHISTRDFSFVAEDHLSRLFSLFAEWRIKVNMMKNTAISFSVCVNNRRSRLPGLIETLERDFKIVTKEDLELVTIRHYNEQALQELKRGKIVLLEERLPNTIQMVVKNVHVPQRIEN